MSHRCSRFSIRPLKGPYLGNIANTYQRPAPAEAIHEPSKTIAQGFATNTITLMPPGLVGTLNLQDFTSLLA